MKSRKKATTLNVQPILLSPDEAIARLRNWVILDVQNPKYATMTIPGAQRLGVEIALKDIPKTQAILLACLTGERSLSAAQQLIQKGYVSIYVLRGGVIGWRRSAYTTQLTKMPT